MPRKFNQNSNIHISIEIKNGFFWWTLVIASHFAPAGRGLQDLPFFPKMRRLHRFCLKRGQQKLSWTPQNCYNIMKWQPLNERNLNIFQIEWKSKSQCRLFFNGDVTDTHFKRTYESCHRDMNETIATLEKRLDNVLFRSLFASSVFSARKMVAEGKVLVNGHVSRFASQQLKVGDILQIHPNEAEKTRKLANHPFIRLWGFLPSYLEVSYSGLSATIIREPSVSEIPHPFSKKMLENFSAFYSKR